MTEAAFHLGALFPVDAQQADEQIEIRCLDMSLTPALPGPRRFFRTHGEALSFALAQSNQWDVFIGVGFRRCPETGDMRRCRCKVKGGNTHVSRLTAAYADLDVGKAGATVDAIVERLMESRVPPAIVVASGRGVHGYWTFDEPTADLERVRRINQGIRDRFGGDNAVDPARILRLAGTLHRKQSPALPVRLISVVTEGAAA